MMHQQSNVIFLFEEVALKPLLCNSVKFLGSSNNITLNGKSLFLLNYHNNNLLFVRYSIFVAIRSISSNKQVMTSHQFQVQSMGSIENQKNIPFKEGFDDYLCKCNLVVLLLLLFWLLIYP